MIRKLHCLQFKSEGKGDVVGSDKWNEIINNIEIHDRSEIIVSLSIFQNNKWVAISLQFCD